MWLASNGSQRAERASKFPAQMPSGPTRRPFLCVSSPFPKHTAGSALGADRQSPPATTKVHFARVRRHAARTHVPAHAFQQIRGRTCSRASRRSPKRALALRAPTAGGGGAGGGAAPAPAPGPRSPRAGTAPPSPAHRRGSAGLVPSSPWLPAIYFVPLVKKMKVAATNERFLC